MNEQNPISSIAGIVSHEMDRLTKSFFSGSYTSAYRKQVLSMSLWFESCVEDLFSIAIILYDADIISAKIYDSVRTGMEDIKEKKNYITYNICQGIQKKNTITAEFDFIPTMSQHMASGMGSLSRSYFSGQYGNEYGIMFMNLAIWYESYAGDLFRIADDLLDANELQVQDRDTALSAMQEIKEKKNYIIYNMRLNHIGGLEGASYVGGNVPMAYEIHFYGRYQ